MPHVLEFMEYGCCFITDMLQIGKVYAHKKFQSWSWMSNLPFADALIYDVQCARKTDTFCPIKYSTN